MVYNHNSCHLWPQQTLKQSGAYMYRLASAAEACAPSPYPHFSPTIPPTHRTTTTTTAVDCHALYGDTCCLLNKKSRNKQSQALPANAHGHHLKRRACPRLCLCSFLFFLHHNLPCRRDPPPHPTWLTSIWALWNRPWQSCGQSEDWHALPLVTEAHLCCRNDETRKIAAEELLHTIEAAHRGLSLSHRHCPNTR